MLVIPIEAGLLGTVHKNLWKILEPKKSEEQCYYDRQEYSEKFWRTEETCCHTVANKIPLAKASEKSLQKGK